MIPLSRRHFLGIAASVPLALPQRLAGTGPVFPLDSEVPRCLLIDAGERCMLRESPTGFARSLTAASIPFERVSAETLTSISYHGLKRAGLQPRRYSCDRAFAMSRSRRSLLLASCAESETQRAQLRTIGGAEAPPFSDRAEESRLRPAQLVVIPGAVMDSPELARNVRRLTDGGSTVLYESGAAFAEREAFETEQRLLLDYFGLSLQVPQEMWPVKREGRTPYVRYHWPSQVMVRDFSRVIPVAGSTTDSTPIARLGKTVVACHRAAGRGALIFLGSPLGPHLGFGDREAQRLLEAFVFPGALAEVPPGVHGQPVDTRC